ncbi:MAG: FAD-dependent oxidoreductase [Chloroflexota bacterium]|nr:FAD-dependent oxidoreductase [Chloroflexota bacterium]
MIPENVLAALRQRFELLTAPVTIDYFHQGESGLIVPGAAPRTPCPACGPTKETLEDLVGVSPKLRLVTHEFHAEPQLVESWNVERVPAVLLRRGAGAPPLRYYGLPQGLFFEVLVEVISAFPAPPSPPAALAEVLDRLTDTLSIVVVGSMRHPAGAQAVASAYQLALFSNKVEATVIEAETFPEVVQQLGLSELPATVVVDKHGFSGVANTMALAQFGVDAQQSDSPMPPQVAPGSAAAIGGAPGAPPVSAPQPATSEPPTVEPAEEKADVAIVGGGPAGLQAALVLVRARKSVALFDAPSPARNAASHGVHNFIGIEGMLPADLARTAWEQIDAVGGATMRRVEVANIERDHEGDFVVTTAEGDRLGAHHVILAFGHRDAIPDIPGFAECWGDTVISCPFCDGYEHRDRVWGLVVPSAGAKATPPLFAYNWTDKVKVFLGGEVDLPEEMATALEAQGLELHRGDITAINHDDGKIASVTLAGGETVPVETLLWSPESLPAPLVERLARGLGLAVDEEGFIAVSPLQQTNVEGIWAAGDAIGSTMAMDAARSGGAVAVLIVQGWFEEPGH